MATSHDIRVLSASADHVLVTDINQTLSRTQYVHRSEPTVKGASAGIATWEPRLVILDIDLEAGAGVKLIDEARERARVGVIALTRRSDLHRELDAYERGADDYVRVPFVRNEFAARVGAVLRRTRNEASAPRVCVGDLEIDVLNRTVHSRERDLHLTSLEQGLLYLLASNAGGVLSRNRILDALWGRDFVIESNIVERHVRSLRAKLHDDWHVPRYIETVRGLGYRLLT